MDFNESEDLRELLQNPSQTRLSGMPSLPLPATLLPAVYVTLCMLYMAVPRSAPLAAAVLMASALMAALTLRSVWLIAMLTVPAVILTAMTGSMTAAALLISLICGTSYGAFFLLNVRSPLVAAPPILACLGAYLITGDILRTAAVLLCLPTAIMLAHTLRRGIPRIRAICHVAVALVLPLLLVGLIALIQHRGTAALTDLTSLVSSFRHALAQSLAAWEIGTGENAGRVVLEGMELALASTLLNILPGTLIAVFAVLGYMTNLICLTLFRTYERSRYLSRRVFALAVSLPAAALFLLGYLLLLVIGENVSIGAQFAETVAENLYLALMPAMILAGILCFIRIFLHSHHRLLCLICLILLFAFSLPAAVTLLSVMGAGSVIWQTLRRRIRFSRNPD